MSAVDRILKGIENRLLCKFVFPSPPPHLTGFYGVLSQLAKTGDVTAEQFSSQATLLFTTFYVIDKI